MIEAVVFDLDGVLLDTEELWDEARREIAEERGGRWRPDTQRAMMGMSSPEWSRYMHDVIGVPDPPERISEEVVERLAELYRRQLPLVDGAVAAVRRIGARWPLGIASSSNRPLIDLFLDLTGTRDLFQATVSSEEVAHGKPRRMSISKRRGGSRWNRIAARRSKTRRTASARRRRPRCP